MGTGMEQCWKARDQAHHLCSLLFPSWGMRANCGRLQLHWPIPLLDERVEELNSHYSHFWMRKNASKMCGICNHSSMLLGSSVKVHTSWFVKCILHVLCLKLCHCSFSYGNLYIGCMVVLKWLQTKTLFFLQLEVNPKHIDFQNWVNYQNNKYQEAISRRTLIFVPNCTLGHMCNQAGYYLLTKFSLSVIAMIEKLHFERP